MLEKPQVNASRKGTTGLVFRLTAAAFVAYFCMYAFRKPFAVANYVDPVDTGVRLKTVFVLSQLAGYAISKFLGIRICSETGRATRGWWLLGSIVVAEVALVLFAVVPQPWKAVAMFVNGLPLGLVWGFVIAYLEGRRVFEVAIAGLSCSYILSTGIMKDVGALLLRSGVSEWWMPALTGGVFFVPFALAVWVLERTPEPDAHDRLSREPRKPMTPENRKRFMAIHGAGMIPLVLLYLLLTAFRDYRDNYGVEIFQQLGLGTELGLFTKTETPVALGVLGGLMLLGLVKDHRRALWVMYGMMAAGLMMVGMATMCHWHGRLSGLGWMVLIGIGSYLAYVPFGALFFDRLMAASRIGGNAIFAIYFADSIAYLGVVAMQLEHDLFLPAVSRLDFLLGGSVILAGAGLVLLGISAGLLKRWMSLPRSDG